jgi:hypothetical protein
MKIWQFCTGYDHFTFTPAVLKIISRYKEILLLINIPKIAMDNSNIIESSS